MTQLLSISEFFWLTLVRTFTVLIVRPYGRTNPHLSGDFLLGCSRTDSGEINGFFQHNTDKHLPDYKDASAATSYRHGLPVSVRPQGRAINTVKVRIRESQKSL